MPFFFRSAKKLAFFENYCICCIVKMSRQRKETNNHRLIAWIEHDLGSTRHWPFQIRRILTRNTHPNNDERYAFFCFMYGNFRLDPRFIVRLMLDTWKFDEEARRSLRETALHFWNWRTRPKFKYFSLEHNRWWSSV